MTVVKCQSIYRGIYVLISAVTYDSKYLSKVKSIRSDNMAKASKTRTFTTVKLAVRAINVIRILTIMIVNN